ncbi:MAG: DUF445 family protein [Clostridiaceae bacterium]|nr:DUF445 family protein [Clostridiaceae bacterium]
MDYALITAPLVGAMIGYITNDIAIKMLFRPLEPKYLFGIKIPFTPGIIPREKRRLARSVGVAIGENLLNDDVLIRTLSSPEFHEVVEEWFDKKVEQLAKNEETIFEIILHVSDEAQVREFIDQLQYDAADLLFKKINSDEFVNKMTSYISEEVDRIIKKQMANRFFRFAARFDMGITNALKDFIIRKVKEMLLSPNTRQVLGSLVQDETKKLLDLRAGELVEQMGDRIPRIKKW